MSRHLKARIDKLWGNPPRRMEPDAFLTLRSDEQARLVVEGEVMRGWDDEELAGVIKKIRAKQSNHECGEPHASE